MARIVVLGAGLAGLQTALVLAADGHAVTVLERDPAEPPDGAEALYDGWERPGVSQFRLPHLMNGRWRQLIARELPEVLTELELLGAVQASLLDLLPEEATGGMRDGDEELRGVFARRPVLEGALATVARWARGITVRRGVTVRALRSHPGEVPRVTGVVTDAGESVDADLVIDAMGRHSPLPRLLAAIGASKPVETKEEHGFVYYSRYFRTADGSQPPLPVELINSDSVTLLALPGDAGVYSWCLAGSSNDQELRALREEAVWERVMALMPGRAARQFMVPLTGVQVMSAGRDHHRSHVVEGKPVVTGLVGVGDSVTMTNPTLGRGAQMALGHALAVRDVLRTTGTDRPDELVLAVDKAYESTVGPLFERTLAYTRARMAEVQADIAGDPHPTDEYWSQVRSLASLAETDPDCLRAYLRFIQGSIDLDTVMDTPGVRDKMANSGPAEPRYSPNLPDRADLLAAING